MDFYGFPAFVRITVGLPSENERLIDALDHIPIGEGRGYAVV
jgi:histidinol-phosphate/aromatic aminotransferase/cobyric acid decarboxylase-like protein